MKTAIYRNIKAGDRIRKLRKDKKLSQGELGEKLGVSRALIGQWENGQGKGPSVFDINRMCELFDCDFRFICGEMEERTEAAHSIREQLPLSEKAIHALLRICIYSEHNRNVFRDEEIAFALLDGLLSLSLQDIAPNDPDSNSKTPVIISIADKVKDILFWEGQSTGTKVLSFQQDNIDGALHRANLRFDALIDYIKKNSKEVQNEK